MQKQKVLAVLSLFVVVVMLAAMGGTRATATPAQTAAATKAAATVNCSAASLTTPGTGKITAGASGEAQRLNASGATFPLPLYQCWTQVYGKLTNVQINYTGGGSGQGKKDIQSQAVDYAGSDSFMSDDELKAAKGGALVHVASTVGAIVPVYNIPELQGKDPLKFTGDELAQIYLGKISKWNDPALVKDNAGLSAVDQDILPVYRSDGSGTTNNFTYYLAQVNQEWGSTIKFGTTVKWPTGQGANGNPGVANAVSQTQYSIGYVELAFVGKLQAAQMQNAAGNYVTASTDTISAAAKVSPLPADLRIIIIGKSQDPQAWPISTMTWLLVYTDQKDPAKALALTRFLWWATHDGQAYAASVGYAPLPDAARALDEANILKIQVNGKQALPADIATPGPATSGTMAATAAK
jgi:phosphate transport system substrate-binding protein